MNEPLISVIIPAHNNANTIRTAIDSIIKQTYKNLEIIIVDDNSKDDTKKVVESIARKDARVQYYALLEDDSERFDSILERNTNAGYAARNFGLDHVKGDLITFQDADDASLLNRIKVQYDLLAEHKAIHITTSWMPFLEELLRTQGSTQMTGPALDPDELYALSQKTKGFVAKVSPSLNTRVPFHFKRFHLINKLFFGTLDPYPGAGNNPLFLREVIQKVRFRKLKDRVWPSFMGRGADRDFNFQVAETFKNSYFFPIPLYLWRK